MNIFRSPEVAAVYDRFYSTETGSRIDNLEKAAVGQLIEPLQRGNMLEVGCGTGHWTRYFLQQGFRLTAIDASQPMLDIAMSKKLSGVNFLQADMQQLPFADELFDQVAVITALEFCSDLEHAITEISRVLKQGGTLIAGVLNTDSELSRNKDRDPVFRHGRFMSRAELADLLSVLDNPVINECVYLSPAFELLDQTNGQETTNGAFFAARVVKT